MARPRKPVERHIAEGTFRRRRHGSGLPPGRDLAGLGVEGRTAADDFDELAEMRRYRAGEAGPMYLPRGDRHPVHAEGAWSHDEHLDDLLKALDARRELVEPAVGFTVRRRVVAVSLWVEAGSEVPEPLVAVRRRSIELLSTDLVRG